MDIILGRQGTGKTYEMYRRIKALPRDARVYIVVPEQFTFAAERNVFNALGVSAAADIGVVSMNRLAAGICAENGAAAPKVLSEEGKALIVKYMIGRRLTELDVFRGVASSGGFADDVTALLSEIKRNALSGADLVAPGGAFDNQLKRKLSDMKLLYDSYTAILGDEYTDQDEFLSVAASFVPASAAVRETYFFFDGFYTFDRSAYSFIEALAEAARGVTFTLCADENDDDFAVTAATAEELTKCAGAAGVRRTLHEGRHNSPPAIDFIEKNVLSPEVTPYEGKTDSVALFAAADIYAEAAWAAARIIELVRDGGCRYGDIAVTVADMPLYEPVLEDVFTQAGIPFFADMRRRVVFSSPVKALLFLTGLGENVTTADIIAFSKTGFAGVSGDEAALMENYAREFGVKGGMWLKDLSFNNIRQTYDLDAVNDIRRRIIAPVALFRERMREQRTAGEYAEAIYYYLEETGFSQRIRDYCDSFQQAADYETANTYAQIYNKITAVLAQMKRFLADTEISVGALHEILSYSLGVCDVGVIPAAPDRVNVGDVVRSRASGVKAMFIMGANEGMLPAAVSPGGILSDADKAALKENGVEFIDTADYKREKESFILYTLLTKPSQKLFVSRFDMSADGENTAYMPDRLFDKLTEMFPENICTAGRFDGVISPETAFAAMTADYSQRPFRLEPAGNEDVYDAVYDCFRDDERYSYYTAAADAALDYSNEAVIKNREAFTKALQAGAALSVTRLERYAACPFSFFTEYILYPQKRVENKPDELDTGSVLHEIIQKYSELIMAGRIDPKSAGEELITDTVSALTDEVCASFKAGRYERVRYSDYLRKKLRRSAAVAAIQITEQLKYSDFLIEEAEAQFKFKKKYVPICIETAENEKIFIEGKIDRIDSCVIGERKYARIIDYKTGSKDFDITKTYFGLSLQLPVYIRAYTDNNADSSPGGVFYLRLKPKMVSIKNEAELSAVAVKVKENFRQNGIALKDLRVIKAMDNLAESGSYIEGVKFQSGEPVESQNVTDSEGFRLILKKTEENITAFYKRMRHADIAIAPYRIRSSPDDTGCRYCKYGDICKFSEDFPGNKYRDINSPAGKNIKEVFAE